MIRASHINRTFRTHRKEPGFIASVKALFSREWVDKAALTDVSLEVKEGEILGLLGANGAGNSNFTEYLSAADTLIPCQLANNVDRVDVFCIKPIVATTSSEVKG